ncbi:MAG TPA: ankyrin repeat domain-containing protein [Patescibacteria group bacterium]|nr:ankyrin repeat domain-containing protein [Patescibacteria group bacterium]
MTAKKPAKDTLRYKHLAARVGSMRAYEKEAALKKAIVTGPQWKIDATLDGIQQKPYDWNYINTTEVMKLAAMFGRLQTVEKISDIMKWDGEFAAQRPVQAAFHIASKHGHYKTADAMAKRGARPNYEAEGTPPAIYAAVEEADFRKIDYLIRRGANKDHLVNIAATSENYMPVVKYLVEEKKSGVNFASEGFWTPFLSAVKYGRDDLALYLLEKGATPQNDKSAGEALYAAGTAGNLKLLEKMLDIGMKPSLNILEHVVGAGQVAAARLLIERGSLNVNTTKQEPLLLALVSKNSDAMTALMIEKGANAQAALHALNNDTELYRYGNRDKMKKSLEEYLAPKPPKAPGFTL